MAGIAACASLAGQRYWINRKKGQLGRRNRHRISAGLHQAMKQQGRFNSVGMVRQIEERFAAALRKFDGGQGDQAGPELAALAAWWAEGLNQSTGVTPGLIPTLVCSYLCGEIDQAWERGWQPADIPRVVARRTSANHAHLAVRVIAEQSEVYRSRQRVLRLWLEQLDDIGAAPLWGPGEDHLALFAKERHLSFTALLRTALELLVMLRHLPAIPVLVPPPSHWDRSTALDAALAWRRETRPEEVRHLERVRALLAKAESTEFDAEADALTAKAQELMTRHAIDDALLAVNSAGRDSGEQPSAIRIGIDDPYAHPKAILLAVIGDASQCRAVWSKTLGFSTVFGFAGDLSSVELLYTSLLLQARNAMVRAGDPSKRTRSRSFRRSFLLGFANRIGGRLEEAASTAVADAVEYRRPEIVPVLAERSCRVENFRNEAFPDLAQHRITTGDWSGWASGAAAAEAAVITRGPSIEETSTA